MVARHLNLALLPVVLMALATEAGAGAWKLPQGHGFTSASVTLRHQGSHLREELSIYGDYGFSKHFDLGLDLNQVANASGHAMVFARLPLRQTSKGLRLSTELAAGGSHFRGKWSGIYRLTLSAGTNFATAHGSGWGNLDLRYEKRSNQDHPLWKLDGSLGLHGSGRFSPLLAIETAKARGQNLTYTIIPSVRIKLSGQSFRPRSRRIQNQIGHRFSNTRDLVVGLSYRHAETQSLGLKIALWHRF